MFGGVNLQAQDTIDANQMLDELGAFYYKEIGEFKGSNEGCSVMLQSSRGEHRLVIKSNESEESRVFRFLDNSTIQSSTRASENYQIAAYKVQGRGNTVLKVISCEDGACLAVNIHNMTCILPSA